MRISPRLAMAASCLCGTAAVASAQLRVISLNGANSGSTTSGPRAGMGTILTAMGSTISDDPTIAGSSGIFKPIDVLCLQEARSGATTGAGYAALLNQTYNTNVYAFGTLDGATTGTGTQAIVYRTDAVQLVSSALVGTASSSGQPRQTLRYQLRPIGYGAAADVYIYNSHFKAGTASSDANRRNIESQAIRADVSALPAGANVMYLGDFNVSNGNEAMFQTLTATGSGQSFDPINKTNWAATDAFKNVHTQSPFDPNADPSSGFNGTGGGMDSRYDFQMISGNLRDGHGVSYITNSYNAFGNNGTHTRDQGINTGTGASPSVLLAEASILDHLPVLADYQLPARMSVAVSSVASRVIVGATVPVDVTVANSAPVQFINGADQLAYNVSGSGAVNGVASGVASATLAGNAHTLAFDTSAPGIAAGTVNVTSSSEAVANGTFTTALSSTVLAHARPSLAADTDLTSIIIDLGIQARGSTASPRNLGLYNIEAADGFRAGLDVDQVNTAGSFATLSANVTTLSNLAQGSSATWQTSLDTTTTGSFATTYTLFTSDEDLPGAANLATLSIELHARVALGGDANLDDVVNVSDFTTLASNFGLSGKTWIGADFTGDGIVNVSDFTILASNFGLTATGPNGTVTPQDWSNLAAAVPEPSTFALFAPLIATISLARPGRLTLRSRRLH